ncbi:hypothetical protein NEMIN01_1072 [Nematocida minor]|uniref:uncharacterized protein n=1 Tax=Nematocida minor TaxID=1912983 RepID=UPI00221E4AA0|nr:uncharacterized protein NEMIN01_1072 [Nematocida minor]KAI5190534.1 hypothetical protein NEMIN01_1072 [Nematocida minor]
MERLQSFYTFRQNELKEEVKKQIDRYVNNLLNGKISKPSKSFIKKTVIDKIVEKCFAWNSEIDPQPDVDAAIHEIVQYNMRATDVLSATFCNMQMLTKERCIESVVEEIKMSLEKEMKEFLQILVILANNYVLRIKRRAKNRNKTRQEIAQEIELICKVESIKLKIKEISREKEASDDLKVLLEKYKKEQKIKRIEVSDSLNTYSLIEFMIKNYTIVIGEIELYKSATDLLKGYRIDGTGMQCLEYIQDNYAEVLELLDSKPSKSNAIFVVTKKTVEKTEELRKQSKDIKKFILFKRCIIIGLIVSLVLAGVGAILHVKKIKFF